MSAALLAAIWLQAAAVPPRAAFNPADLPGWSKGPSAAEMMAAYPPAALAENLAGSAVVECTVGGSGELADCAVASESVSGAGFGAAALALAPKFLLPTRSPSGATTVGRTVRFPLRWLNTTKAQVEPIIMKDDAGRSGEVSFNCRVTAERKLDNCVLVDARPQRTSLLPVASEVLMRFVPPARAKVNSRLMVLVQVKPN